MMFALVKSGSESDSRCRFSLKDVSLTRLSQKSRSDFCLAMSPGSRQCSDSSLVSDRAGEICGEPPRDRFLPPESPPAMTSLDAGRPLPWPEITLPLARVKDALARLDERSPRSRRPWPERTAPSPTVAFRSRFQFATLSKKPAPAFLLATSEAPRQRSDRFGISIRAPGKFAKTLMSDPHLPKAASRCPP